MSPQEAALVEVMRALVGENDDAALDAAGEAPPRFQRIGTEAIMATAFAPIRWVVPGYVPEGLSLLVGRQKLGKTWLAIDFAIAVACGGLAMGAVACESGDVLYIDLENGARRIQRRIAALYGERRSRPDMSRLEWAQAAPAGNRLVEALDEWRQSVGKPRLVVIDVLQRLMPARGGRHDMVLAALQQWASTHGIAVVVLHHARRGGDPREADSLAADTTLVLGRDGGGLTLVVRGRDVEDKESAMSFAAGAWSLAGDAAEVRRSGQRAAILAALGEAGEAMSPSELAEITGMKNGNVRYLLFSMARTGEVVKTRRGSYLASPAPQDAEPEVRPGVSAVSDVSGVSDVGGVGDVRGASDVSDVSDVSGVIDVAAGQGPEDDEVGALQSDSRDDGGHPQRSSSQGGAERGEGADPGIHAGSVRQRKTTQEAL